jgi:hypothetical protein
LVKQKTLVSHHTTIAIGRSEETKWKLRTADERGSEGASGSRSGGDAASRSEGGALQKHVRLMGFAPGNWVEL